MPARPASSTRTPRRVCRGLGAALAATLLASVATAAGGPAPSLQHHVAEPARPTGHTVLGAPVYRKTFVSPSYAIDRIYRSMQGPSAMDRVMLGEPAGALELLWITANYTEIVSDDGGVSSPEFMCHSNLSINVRNQHRETFGSLPRARLFTLSQGQMDVRFPDGFGIPVVSRQPLQLVTQVLNLNEQREEMDVRHRVTVEYVRQADLEAPMKPLIVLNAQGFKALDASARYFGEPDANVEDHGPGCSVGEPVGGRISKDEAGGQFVGHWVVKPGREENDTLVTKWMRVPYDTTVHMVAVHLHPFAESLSLIDLTTGQVVFRSGATGPADRIGLTRVQSYSSAEGFPVYRDHEYQLSSVYQNTSGEDQDSMAVIFLYAVDKDFSLPPEWQPGGPRRMSRAK